MYPNLCQVGLKAQYIISFVILVVFDLVLWTTTVFAWKNSIYNLKEMSSYIRSAWRTAGDNEGL